MQVLYIVGDSISENIKDIVGSCFVNLNIGYTHNAKFLVIDSCKQIIQSISPG